MLDLKTQEALPHYEFRLEDGSTKSYDPLPIGYKLQALEGEEDPEAIQKIVNKVFGIDVDAFTAMTILHDFLEFAEKNLEEPLKNVSWRVPSSITSTDSRPENSKS